jgi:2-deoxy-D-gluconate 3-dehydrogenase
LDQSGTSNPFDLTGKVAIVTGANGGIGLGMAEGLARAGAAIAIAARNASKAEAALAQLQGLGAETMFVATDVADRSSCKQMADAVAKQFGRVDILIANAGIGEPQRAADIDEQGWQRTIGINLDGAFFSAQAAYPHLQAAGGGKIVMIGSMTSIFGAPFAVHYAASKGGVVQLAKSLAVGWARDNIQVNTILPGWILTDIIAGRKEQNAAFDAAIVARTPARRWGEPRDLAGTAVFLCSQASDFVTGAVIPVDGGYSVM